MPGTARRRALKIFRDSLELTTTARRSFLRRGHGAAVRAELAALVAADRCAGVPESVGGYRVERVLGRGGMGTVYLATRGGARVAVKVLTGRCRRAWRRECRILAALDHPNIVRLLDHGTLDHGSLDRGSLAGGSPFLVMELVDGVAIDRHCDDRRLDVDARLALFRQVLEAVHHAHGQRVIHRDLKPANVLVTRDGVPKLLDFGVARLSPPGPRRVTTLGRRRMTLTHASPEQASGAAVTTASDVYSLGVLLYGLLTGHWPYRVESASEIRLLRAIAEEPPEPPSAAVRRAEKLGRRRLESADPRDLARLRGVAPEALVRRLRRLDAVVTRALAKRPEERYGSVAEMERAIRP